MNTLMAVGAPTSLDFRRVMSHFATGVVVVTGMTDAGYPVGMTCQSFVSLSLEPPLVSIAPALSSTSWPAIESTGWFAINVLAETQRDISGTFARSGGDKFAAVAWSRSSLGLPLIDGALAHIECRVEEIYPAGDHEIVVGRVFHLDDEAGQDVSPLVYHRSGYVATQKP